MSSVRRLHYEGLIWRFWLLIYGTVVTAGFTTIGVILGRYAEGKYR